MAMTYMKWKQNGIEKKIAYPAIKAPETTKNGRTGKITPFGFIEKPGGGNQKQSKWAQDVVDHEDKKDKDKEKEHKKKDK